MSALSEVLPFLGVQGSACLLVIATIAAYLYFDIRKKQSFWERKGIKHVKPKFLLGSIEIIPSKHISEKIRDTCSRYPEDRYFGMYQLTMPTLMIKDPDLIKQVTVKEFDHFVNHRPVVDTDVDPLWSKNLFASRDERWRDLRATLSPSFTGSKMKIMFLLMEECAQHFVDYFKKEVGVVELEMKDILTRYANDVIATTAFGLKCNSLEDKQNEFLAMGKNASNFTMLKIFKFFIYGVSPTLCRLLRVRIISSDVTKYFSKIIEDTVRTRKEKNIVRPDMIHLLLEAQKESQKEITLEDITSQAFIFFLAGFETVSISLTFAFYELAANPEVQDRLREEIQSLPEKITYESLVNLKYLDMFMSEVLRKWPPFGITDREVSKDFTIEPIKPDEKPLHLEKGLVCGIPIFAIHSDPKFYPNPEKFDPERFSDENKHKIHPSAYLPFGAGPRNCIGSRFALLEGKLIIAHVLRNFEVVQTERTPNPVVLDENKINLSVKGGMWLGLKKLN